MKKRIRTNKVVSALLTLSLIFCQISFLTGCGKEDVERNKDQVEEVLPDGMDAEDIADMLESGMDVDEVIERVEEIKDGEVTATDKPAGATVTEKPEPSKTPEPTATPSPTATPEPTPTPHVHEWTEEVTRAAGCAVEGEKKLVCECGEEKVEAIPATGAHNWVEGTTVVHHEALGHVEEVQVQVGTTKRTEYECAACGHREDSPDALKTHRDSFVPTGDMEHVFARTIAWDYEEPVYETQSQWVVDSPAWDETVGTGTYTCSVCGATK